jgi:hypothetical protein
MEQFKRKVGGFMDPPSLRYAGASRCRICWGAFERESRKQKAES